MVDVILYAMQTPGTVLCAAFGSQQMASTSQPGAIARRKYTIRKRVLEHGASFLFRFFALSLA
jgi:hypothetical protein